MINTLLIVDDHQAIRDGIKLIFAAKSQGQITNIIEASDGPNALNQLTNLTPDVAIVDLMLPGMDGSELSRKLKEKFPSLKIAILTAKTDPETTAKLMATKIVDKVLAKPIDNNLLYEEIINLAK